MQRPLLRTARLRLVAVTPELARAQLEGPTAFAAGLTAALPADWPPPLTDDTHEFIHARLSAHPHETGWWFWIWLLVDRMTATRTAVGVGGFKGPPDPSGTVEIGYSVVPSHQRRGIATEAVDALVRRAFADAHVKRICAETFADLVPSIRVLEHNGFAPCDEPPHEAGAIRFELRRAAALVRA
jgi:ribosomal-protein-alanine N-acetyltransferase